MGVLTSENPKCMTEVSPTETIISRQLRQLSEVGITDIVITTGYFDSVLYMSFLMKGMALKIRGEY